MRLSRGVRDELIHGWLQCQLVVRISVMLHLIVEPQHHHDSSVRLQPQLVCRRHEVHVLHLDGGLQDVLELRRDLNRHARAIADPLSHRCTIIAQASVP